MKVIARYCLGALALAGILAGKTGPSAARDLVEFVNDVTARAAPAALLILHNKESRTNNMIDTIRARLDTLKFKYDYRVYNAGERPKDIAREVPSWPSYGVVVCMGELRECDYIKDQANSAGFDGEFYNYYLEKR